MRFFIIAMFLLMVPVTMQAHVTVCTPCSDGTDNDFDAADTYTVTNPGITDLGTINMNNPAEPVLYCDVTARLNQIRWGTDAASEFFSIPHIKIGYELQGNY